MSNGTIGRYLSLTKPGVLFGNVVTGIAGFCLASANRHLFDAGLFVATIGGMTLVIAAACTLNNVLDQDIDKIMARTRARAVASGTVSAERAWSFAVLLGVSGLAVLGLWTNLLVVAIGVLGFIIYVWLYGALSKRRSIHGTLVGSLSGAAPILAGYVAVRGHIDAGAILVFLALFFWQFPEFFAIAIYREQEYAAAGVPVITVMKGVPYTKWRIAVYALLFVISALLLTPLGYAGYTYLAVMALVCAWWLWLAAKGFRAAGEEQSNAWARRMFHASINVLLIYSFLIAIGSLLP